MEDKKRLMDFRFKRFLPFLISNTTLMLGLAFLVGIGGGFGAVIFRWLIDFFTFIFFERIPGYIPFAGGYAIILVPAIGAFFFSPLIYFFAREAKGHGVPEVMEAMELRGGRIRPVVGIIKSLASSLCIGSGGSVGREGPIVQIGSAIGSTFGQRLHLSDEKTRNLVACGAASGIAATFNAPIGGVFFALEVILRDFSTRRLGGVVIASVTASVIGRIFLGNRPFIDAPPYAIKNPVELIFYLLFGLLLVPFCILFTRLIYRFEDFFDSLPVHELARPVLGGLLLGCIGFFYPQVFGVGYENIENVVYNSLPFKLMLILIPLKVIAVSLTLGSGGSGGIFAPSLVLGSLLGGSFGTILSSLFPQAGLESGGYALVGMGVFFAAVAHAPMTAILIIFELTGDYLIILPLMLAVTVTTIASERLHPESIYTLKLVRRGINIRRETTREILENINVEEILEKKTCSVPSNATVERIISIFEKEKQGMIPVIEGDGTFYGMITFDEIITLLEFKEALKDVVLAGDLAVNEPYLETSDSLQRALERFIETGRDILPVLKRINGKMKLVGIVSKHDLLCLLSRSISHRRG